MRIGLDFRTAYDGDDRSERVLLQQRTLALLAAIPGHICFLICDLETPLAAIPESLHSAANVFVAYVPAFSPPSSPAERSTALLRDSAHFQNWLDTLQLDLFHIPALSDSVWPPIHYFDVCPLVISIDDRVAHHIVTYLNDSAQHAPYLDWHVLRSARQIIVSEVAASHLCTAMPDIYSALAIWEDSALGSAELLSIYQGTRVAQRVVQRIAMWTPLPPLASGIADYSAELLQQLSTHYTIEVFVDDNYLPTPGRTGTAIIQHADSFARRQRQQPFALVIYQIGASFFHTYMLDTLRNVPGIAVIHDLNWGRLLYAQSLRDGTTEQFTQNVLELAGETAAAEFTAIDKLPLHERYLARDQYFSTHYLIEDIARYMIGLIVHMPWAKRDLEQRYGLSNVSTILMGVKDPQNHIDIYDIRRGREWLQIGSKTFVVGLFGIVDRIKRVTQCLKAFAMLKQQVPDSAMIVMGEILDPAYRTEIEELTHTLGIAHEVHFIGRADQLEFDRYMSVSDIIVNLRYPSHRQMSAVMVRAFAVGKPLIISDIPEWNFVPSSFCLRVKPDDREVTELARCLIMVALDPQRRATMSKASRAYYEQFCTIEYMTQQYIQIIDQFIPVK